MIPTAEEKRFREAVRVEVAAQIEHIKIELRRELHAELAIRFGSLRVTLVHDNLHGRA